MSTTSPSGKPSVKGTDETAVCAFVVGQAKEIFGEPTVILFGSRARGTPRANSDFDFAIDAPKADHAQWVRFRDVIKHHAPTLLPIDLVDLSDPIEARLQSVIHDEGQVLIGKGENAVEKSVTIAKLKNVVSALERVTKANAPEEILNAAIIQHFEFCFELAWKTLQHFATEQAQEVRGPRDAFTAGVVLGIIEDDEVWRSILNDRNLTVHTYNEALASAITDRIKRRYLTAFKGLVKKI